MGHQHAFSADHSFYEGNDLEALADMPRYYRWIMRTFRPHLQGRTLEVGAGVGNFSSHYLDHVDAAVLLEPAQNLYPRLDDRFRSTNHVTTHCGLLEAWYRQQKSISEESVLFDSIVMVNVLEHIEDDYGTAHRLQSMLRPGGKLLLFVPAKQWLYGSLDTVFHHYRRYSYSRLKRVVHRAGLELISLNYFDLAGILPWFITGRLLRQTQINPKAVGVYDRFVVPAASTLERFLCPPIGKNLICVAQAPQHPSFLEGLRKYPVAA